MAANNVNVMVKEAIRALKANNKAEARALLEKATELDSYNEQAWLWLSGVVETEEDQRTCLQNVMFINPGNQNAAQGLAMLDAKSAARPKTEPKPSNPQAFADFDLPSGNDWLAELDEMRQTAGPNTGPNPFNVSLDDYDIGGEEFSDPFSTSGDPFSAPADPFATSDDAFSDPFATSDGPFSASLPAVPTPPASANRSAAPSSADLEDDLDALFGGTEAAVAAPTTTTKQQKRREKPQPKKERDPLADIPDDADAGTLFGIIPKEIRMGSLPGTPPKPPTLLRVAFMLLMLGNVVAIALIFTKVTTP